MLITLTINIRDIDTARLLVSWRSIIDEYLCFLNALSKITPLRKDLSQRF